MAFRTDAAGTTSYTYDTADRLKILQDPASAATPTYSYNTLSQVNQVSYGPGADVRTLGYNTLHQLTSDTIKTNAGTTIASISYGYDLNGNETSKTATGFAGATTNTYTYDFANRLTSWTAGGTTASYGYDNSGNRTQAGSQTFSYNARNEITSSGYTYTARGTMAAAGAQATTSDAYGQTITAGTQTYAYDALGRVVTDATSGGGTRNFSYTGTGNTLADDGSSTYGRDPSGALVGAKTGSTGVLAWTDRHTDVVGVFAASGTALAGSTAYDPLGTVLATSSPVGSLGYQSGWTEAATNRVNMAARWYDVNTGQFDNRDTAANNPVPASVAADAYAYGNDNPLTALDPSGHRPCFEEGDCGRSPAPAIGTVAGTAVARVLAPQPRMLGRTLSRTLGRKLSRTLGRRLPSGTIQRFTGGTQSPIGHALRGPLNEPLLSTLARILHPSDGQFHLTTPPRIPQEETCAPAGDIGREVGGAIGGGAGERPANPCTSPGDPDGPSVPDGAEGPGVPKTTCPEPGAERGQVGPGKGAGETPAVPTNCRIPVSPQVTNGNQLTRGVHHPQPNPLDPRDLCSFIVVQAVCQSVEASPSCDVGTSGAGCPDVAQLERQVGEDMWRSPEGRACVVWGGGGMIANARGGPWGAAFGFIGGCVAAVVALHWN
jgi:RHS repeat-associated protein